MGRGRVFERLLPAAPRSIYLSIYIRVWPPPRASRDQWFCRSNLKRREAIGGRRLACTRYSFTCLCACTDQSSLYYPRLFRITPHYCNTMRDCCAIYDPPPTLPLYAIHHSILAMATSCKGQVFERRAPAAPISIYLSIHIRFRRVNSRFT